jgi:hypothetical protein
MPEKVLSGIVSFTVSPLNHSGIEVSPVLLVTDYSGSAQDQRMKPPAISSPKQIHSIFHNPPPLLNLAKVMSAHHFPLMNIYALKSHRLLIPVEKSRKSCRQSLEQSRKSRRMSLEQYIILFYPPPLHRGKKKSSFFP